MELRHLRYFVAVADELHFGRAAARAFVSQPTLSQQVRTLEDEFGARLFDRSRRGVALTDVGRVFLPHARRVLDAASQAEAAVRAAAEGRAGALRIGYEGAVLRAGLSAALRTFRAAAPDVELDFLEAGSREQAEAVRAGRADAGFVLLPVDEEGLEVRSLGTAPVLLVMPAGHRLAGRATVAVAELAGEPFVMWARSPASAVYDALVRACHAAGFEPDVAQEIRHMESLLGFVAAGVGVATVHEARAQRGYPGVAYARLVEPALTIETGVVWRRGDVSPALARFIVHLRDVLVRCDGPPPLLP